MGLSSRTRVTSTSPVIVSPGTHRRLEAPVHVQEHRAGTGQVLGHHRIQNRAGNAALDDNAAEPRPGGELGVIVDRTVSITREPAGVSAGAEAVEMVA